MFDLNFCAMPLFLYVVSGESFWGMYRKNEPFISHANCDGASTDAILAEVAGVTSDVECLGLCSRNERCASAMFDEDELLCVLKSQQSSCLDATQKDREKVIF